MNIEHGAHERVLAASRDRKRHTSRRVLERWEERSVRDDRPEKKPERAAIRAVSDMPRVIE